MPTEVQPRSKHRLQWLAMLLAPGIWLERARGWKRLALLAAYLLISAVLAAFIARSASLRGLPDIGDPFVVEAFVRDQTTPTADEDANAFTWYQRAWDATNAGIVPEHWLRQPGRAIDDPVARYLLLENRLAFECWLMGTEQTALVTPEPGAFTAQRSQHRLFQILGRVEAERLLNLGDPDGAWRSCRALLRFSRHLARPARPARPADTGSESVETWGLDASSIHLRIATLHDYQMACMLAEAWAINPETSPEALRLAVGDFAASERLAPPSESLRAFYLDTIRQLEQIPPQTLAGIKKQQAENGDPSRWYVHSPGFVEAVWFLHAEPERSRRIVQHVLAQWLDYFETPPSSRPPRFEPSDSPDIVLPQSSPSTRALDPRTLAGWYRSSWLARRLLEVSMWLRTFDQERELYEQTLFTLLSEWHLREHSTYPASVADLEPYLESLPDADADAMRLLVPAEPLDAPLP